MKYTTEEIIQKFESIHGDTYDYSKVVYKGIMSKVTIVCKEHGDFHQAPNTHLCGKGCRKCAVDIRANSRRLSIEEVIERANKVHSNKFDYSLVKFKNTLENVKVICPEHGIFETSISNHFAGNDCPKCSQQKKNDAKRSNTKEFLEKVKKIHGDRYDYSEVEYGKTNIDKVKIGCKVHGVFSMTPANFLQGRGCPSCSKHGFKPNRPLWIYILKSDSGITKLGISYDAVQRCKKINKDSKIDFKLTYRMYLENGQHAFDVEQQVLKQLRSKYEQVELDFSGSTECFYDVPEVVIESMIVSELLKIQDTKMSET